MSILTQIKQDQLEARKTKDTTTAGILTVILGEIARSATKVESDAEVFKIINTYVNGVKKKIAKKPFEGDSVILAELDFLNKYLPKRLTESEISAIIASNEFADVESVMGFFSKYQKEHGVLVDMQTARKIFETK